MSDPSFQPVASFDFTVNRAERTQQVRLLAPLLTHPSGRVWFLERIDCPCTVGEAESAQPYHLCFPLRDLFTRDYHVCRPNSDMTRQFIAYYNQLFGLPENFAVETVWLTAPGKAMRHPAASGRAGWFEAFLKERLPDPSLYAEARRMVELLRTEADLLIVANRHVILVECKFRSTPSSEQYTRQQEMGAVLAKRLKLAFHFALVVDGKRDVAHAKIHAPYVTWVEIADWLDKRSSS